MKIRQTIFIKDIKSNLFIYNIIFSIILKKFNINYLNYYYIFVLNI